MTWKQFWCRHIWKHLGREFLREETHRNYDTSEVRKYDFYAGKFECVKCQRIQLKENQILTYRKWEGI